MSELPQLADDIRRLCVEFGGRRMGRGERREVGGWVEGARREWKERVRGRGQGRRWRRREGTRGVEVGGRGDGRMKGVGERMEDVLMVRSALELVEYLAVRRGRGVGSFGRDLMTIGLYDGMNIEMNEEHIDDNWFRVLCVPSAYQRSI